LTPNNKGFHGFYGRNLPSRKITPIKDMEFQKNLAFHPRICYDLRSKWLSLSGMKGEGKARTISCGA
ncbi:MAG: hypothetical protein FWC27_05645, partial [Firmicutes bacterium]|nr:hypothetical protein [Bacillota bacterium]